MEVSVTPIDENTALEVRTPWIDCPWCEQHHTVEFIHAGDRWLGFCRASGRPLAAMYETGDYRSARGAAPAGNELPEDVIRRMRDGSTS